jgi:hypothetical protein
MGQAPILALDHLNHSPLIKERIMVTTLDIRAFIKTDAYQKLFNNAVEQLNIKLKEEDEIPVGFVNIYVGYIKIANRIVSVSLSDLEALCDDEKIINYIRIHINEVRGDNKDGELIEVLGRDKAGFICDLLEYFFLKNHPDKLSTYLDLLKIPGYKKYAKQLKNIYSRI